MTGRRPLLALACAFVFVGSAIAAAPPGASAVPPAPVILNAGAQNSGDAQWMETQAQPDAGGASVKQFVATFLVQHALGRQVTTVGLTFNGVETLAGVTGQTYVAAAGGIQTSRVTASLALGSPGGFTCPPAGALRSVDAPVAMRVRDSTGEFSETVSSAVRFVAAANCVGVQDFPTLTSSSQNVTQVTPGFTVTYSFTCADADLDVLSSDDACERANIRWRRLNDGMTSEATLKTGMSDDSTQVHQVSFPSRGYYVVEAQLGNENGAFPNTGGAPGGWWRLGNAAVNDSAASLDGSISYPGANPSDPPSVNEGASVAALASVADAGGAVQVVEWDATGDGTFERQAHTVPSLAGGDLVHPALTSGQLSQAIDTTTPGLVTTRVRLTDNGALDAADGTRRQITVDGRLRINARPTASDLTVATDEDAPLTVNLAANDSDAQPDPLTYEIVSGPAAGTGSLGAIAGNQVLFTPDPDFSGSTSFTYRVRDGGSATVAAWAYSLEATVTIDVRPVNDAPLATDALLSISARSVASFTLAATDVDGDVLAFTAPISGPAHGTLTCDGPVCEYQAARGFMGTDGFTFLVSDGNGGTDTGAVEIKVTPGRGKGPGRP